ncbi:MAG: M56 family metallopeptidase [Phycisphaerae bacterium]|nr:M56 family metallopeptidase [Phycisphaerae bacterium]
MESFSMQLWPFFEWLLQTTIQASLLIFLILLVQLMLRGKLGVRWHYCLWLLLLIRLVIPWAPESRFSIFNLFHTFFGRGPTELVAGNSAIAASNSVVGQPTALGIFFTILPIIWLVGALVLIFYMFFTNLAFFRSIRRERPLVNQKILKLFKECKSQIGIQTILRIVVTDRVKSPALFGFVMPRLLLPLGMIEALSLEELRCVFLHELAHLKRHDVFVAHFVSLVQILHWFNPLVWLAFYRMRADRELACDALVLSKMNVGEPKKYGRTIISLVELFYQNRHLPAMVGIMEDKLQLKRRIKMIAKFKKISKKWSLVAVLVIGLIAGIALTNATSSSKDDADISEDTPMVWVGYPEGHEASNPPQGYVGYSQGDNRPITRGSIRRSRSQEGDSGKGEPVYYPVSSEGPAPMGYGGYGGKPESLGYGGYAVGYGGYRVKDTKETDSPDGNTPAPTP